MLSFSVRHSGLTPSCLGEQCLWRSWEPQWSRVRSWREVGSRNSVFTSLSKFCPRVCTCSVVVPCMCDSNWRPLGMCQEEYDYGRREVAGITLNTREVSSGNRIWLPNLNQLPAVEINSPQIPLVSWPFFWLDEGRVACIHHWLIY